jgi:hypothetical protein
VRIADLRRQGLGVRAVAAELDRSPATVSRELRRNRDLGSGQYRPFAAQRLAAARRARPGRGKLVRDPVLRHFVAERLEKRWSPEQISRALRGEFPDEPERHLVHETIYQAVYRPELGGLRRDLPKVLRTGRRRRRPRRRPDARRAGALADMTAVRDAADSHKPICPRPAAGARQAASPESRRTPLPSGAGGSVGTVPRATAGRPVGSGPGRSDGAALRSHAAVPAAGHPCTPHADPAPPGI